MFRAAERPSVNLCQLSVWLGDVLSTSVNFQRGRETIRQLLSPFHVAGRSTVNNGRSPGCTES